MATRLKFFEIKQHISYRFNHFVVEGNQAKYPKQFSRLLIPGW